MEKYTVNITDEALADMEALYEHIAKNCRHQEMLWDSIIALQMLF